MGCLTLFIARVCTEYFAYRVWKVVTTGISFYRRRTGMVHFAVLNRGVREVKMGLQVGPEDLPTNLYPEIEWLNISCLS